MKNISRLLMSAFICMSLSGCEAYRGVPQNTDHEAAVLDCLIAAKALIAVQRRSATDMGDKQTATFLGAEIESLSGTENTLRGLFNSRKHAVPKP